MVYFYSRIQYRYHRTLLVHNRFTPNGIQTYRMNAPLLRVQWIFFRMNTDTVR